MFFKEAVLKYFAKFTPKYLRRSLFFNKVTDAACNSEKEALAQVFSCEFCKLFKELFLTEHLWTSASENG